MWQYIIDCIIVQISFTLILDKKINSLSSWLICLRIIYHFSNGYAVYLIKYFQSFLLAARSFCPPIYPLGEQQWQLIVGTPLICLHSLQIVPSPLPPSFASQTVIDCQPLMVCSYVQVISVNGLLVHLFNFLLPILSFDDIS